MASPVIESMRSNWQQHVCSVTVIRVRRHRDLMAGVRHWQRVRREMRSLAESPLTVRVSVSVRARQLTFVSLWPDRRSLLLFNGLGSHVSAVRWVIRGHHDTWTGIFSAIGRSDLSRDPGEPHWLEALDARAARRACGTDRQ